MVQRRNGTLSAYSYSVQIRNVTSIPNGDRLPRSTLSGETPIDCLLTQLFPVNLSDLLR